MLPHRLKRQRGTGDKQEEGVEDVEIITGDENGLGSAGSLSVDKRR